MTNYELYQGDCLDIMPALAAGSVDAVIADIPYGTTQCRWDSVIPFAPMWASIKHVLKPKGAAVLFGSEPFSSLLRMSNLDEYKYDWIWEKSQATGFLNAWKQPMRSTENVSVFYNTQCVYNPEITDKPLKNIRPPSKKGIKTTLYGDYNIGERVLPADKSMPQTILKFNSCQQYAHPTQKPVALMEYLIKTYTNPGDTVLDFTMGSGTTGVACMKTGRNFIGIELDETYFQIAQTRIKNAAGDYVTTPKEKASGQIALWDIV